MNFYSNTLKNTKKNDNQDNNSILDCNSEDEDYETAELKNQKINFSIKKEKEFEIGSLKNLPTVFFITFLLVFSILTLKFAISSFPLIKSDLYIQKFSLDYFSMFFGKESMIVKLILTTSQFLLITLMIFLFSLMKQRISVPELKHQQWKNYSVLALSIISIFSLLSLTFYSEETLNFSKTQIKIVDNIVFIVYMLSTFLFCLFTYQLLNILEVKEFIKDKKFLSTKKILLIIMGLQIFLYSISLGLVSFYNPIIKIEQILANVLIFSLGINSTLFVFCKIFFIFTLRYDLLYVNLNLQILPDIEYFIDFEADCKEKLTF